MAARYSSCPSCGFNKKSGLLTGSHFPIHRCRDCGRRYCYECGGSNGGRRCPDCSSEKKTKDGEAYLR